MAPPCPGARDAAGARGLPNLPMPLSLFDSELQLLILASPLGLEGRRPERIAELDALARRGLVRACPVGPYKLTDAGRAALAACVQRGCDDE